MYDFITDLDNFFCEEYAGYDKLSILPDYKMPMMQATEIRDGRKYSYTLPANTMRLAKQEKKEQLLAALKEKMVDTTFSFTFNVEGFFGRLKSAYSKYGFYKNFKKILEKYKVQDEEVYAQVNIDQEIWIGIRKNKFQPSKNLLLTLALTLHFSYEDTHALLLLLGQDFNFEIVKDVVLAYLLQNKVYNRAMIEAALTEYKVENLFLK